VRVVSLAAVLGSLPLATAVAGREYSSDAPLEITADTIVYEGERELYVAEGNVRVVQEQRSIEADWVVFSSRTRRGIAAGDVVVVDGEEVLEARFIDFNIDSLQGVCFETRLDTGPDGFKVGAQELEKTGDKTYHVQQGVFTTCRCPSEDDQEPWKIVVEEGDVRLGGYAQVKKTTVDVLGIPTLWLPWLIFPVKTERESGVLLPDFGMSKRSGFQVGLPLFWAARDNVNVLVTPNYLQKRGVQAELEIETVYGSRSATEFYLAYIHDTHKDFDDPKNRWGAALASDTFLPAEWRLRADIRLISDNDYVEDFREFARFRRDRFLESQAFGFRHFGDDGRMGVTLSGIYTDDIQARGSDVDDDRDRYLLQRFGAARFDQLSGRSRLLPGLVTHLGTEFINFYPLDRPQEDEQLAGQIVEAYFVDVGVDGRPNTGDFGEGDTAFQEGELLADYGQRLILHPRIAYPLRLWDALELYPEVGYQQTLYRSENRDFQERGLFTARLDVTSRLYRDLDLPLLPPVTHLLEPKLSWALVQQREQKGNPVFVPRTATPQLRVRQLALDNVVLDTADRIEAANMVKLGLGNRFYMGGGAGRAASMRVEVELSGLYDFSNRDAARLVLDGRTSFATGMASNFSLSLDPKTGKLDEGLLGVAIFVPPAFRVLRGGVVGARYRYLRQIPRLDDSYAGEYERVSQISADMRLGLGRNWSVGYGATYSLEQQNLLVNQGFLEYTSKCGCWAVGADFGDDSTRGFQFNFRYTLLGFGGKGGAFLGGRGVSTREFGESAAGVP